MNQRLLTFCIFILLPFSLLANDRYWVGGSGNWNDPAHWSVSAGGSSGAAIPSAQDAVYIAPFSGTVTVSGEATCYSLFIGESETVATRILEEPFVLEGNGTISIHGSLTVSTPFTDHFSGTWLLTDERSDFRDNTIASVKTNAHVFSGKFVFAAPAKGNKTNSWQIADALYVNNTLKIENGAALQMEPSVRIAVLDLDDNGALNGPQVLSRGNGNTQRSGNPSSPQSHTVTTVVVPNLCNGQCNATATAVVTGGSGNFSYQWSTVPVQTTPTATGLCAGTYLVVVTDLTNGDQIPAFAIITDPPPLVIFFSNTSPLCNGQCDGTSSATVAGGTPGYTYDWQPGNPTGDGTPNVTNLCAGTYSLTVTDVNGCSVTQVSVITQPAVLTPNGISTNVTCFNACDGIATVAPTGGTAPYSYLWAPGGQTTPGIAGLCPGTYTCTVTDNHNCTTTYTTTITQPNLLQASITHNNCSCFGVCDGSANSSVSGGTGPYTYSWLPGGQTTPNISGQCAGSYTLNVTDANGCTAQATVNITEPPQLIVAPTGVNISCFNSCNGTAAANASGGTPGYTYTWSPSGGNGATASSLCPGTYTVDVTDVNGCSASGNVTITEPPQLLANASDVDITCNGSCNGSASSNPAGGIGPYTYNWMPGNLNTQTINNLCPGSYTLTVTDANLCTATATVTITQPPQLQVSINSTNVSCNSACNGSATANPSGGLGPYTYSWAPGGQTTQTISSLCPGSYTVTVTDANLCTQTQTVTITQPNPLTVTISSSPISCNSNCDGTAAAVVSGGTPTFSYSWSPGNQTTPSLSNLCAGSYTVTVTDVNGCTNNASVTLTQPTALTLTPGSVNATCNGSCNGSASITPSGGTGPYNYSWAPGGQTTSAINNLCAGSYTVTVTDAAGCSGTATINITQPTALQAGVTSVNVSCNGGCNGSAASNPSGGTGPYTFLWSPGGQTTPSVNSLCPGTYTVTITDVNGCTVNQQVNITQPPPLLAVVAATTSSCGLCNGTASVAVSGGTAPYAYFWTPTGQTNPTATSLCVGLHTVTVTDAAGCTTTAVANVTQVVNIIITSSTSSLSCAGACDGVASANASGGSNPYTYLWQPGGQTTQTITGLCSGSYTVTATDANNCFNTATVTFLDPPQLVTSVSSTNASCNGVCDGTATASPSGGTGAYSYSWAPGGQTTQTATGLCAGTYTVTVMDANNCSTTQTVTITEAPIITANATVTDANCTLCDGSITANPSGGIGPYTYSWAPGAQTTQTISNLCPGIYTVTITDAVGCSVNTSIAVSNINGPTVASSFTDASCNTLCDGTANANVTGGIAPFTYDWSPGNPTGDGTPNVTGLCAGTWFCQVTDNVGCITFATVTISEPQTITLNPTVVNVSCNGMSDGSITANPSGGTGPYSYLWMPGSLTTQTISGLVAGTYTLTVTDANNCTATQQVTITEPQPVTATMSFTNVQCFAACNGTATVNVSGGTGPYSYNWSSGQGTAMAVNLCPGTYTVDVTDANGCPTQQTVTITEPTQLVTTLTSTNVTCNNLCDGTATVNASGGTPGYSYTWSPGGGTTPTATGLCAGAYSVITMDMNGCSSVLSVTIQQPAAITLATSSGPLSCFGSCNGVASVNASGGTPGYTYTWAPGGQTTPTATGLCAGTYTVTVTDMAGCTQNGTTTVTQPSVVQANTSFSPTTCNGNCDGTASANPVGGTGPYSFLWAPGGQTTNSINGLCAGTYTVTVRDANGCTDVQVVTVTAASAMTLTTATAPANCGACDGTMSITPVGGSAPFTYSWSGGLPPQPNQSNLCAGIYSVTVTDAIGCSSSFTLTLNNSGGPTGENVVTTDASCPSTCDGTATVTPIGGLAPYTYVWNPGGQTVNSLTNMCAGNYFLQVTDANGCIRFSPVTINGPQPIVGNPFVSNATCTGICDGSITLAPSGGTGPYTYSWAPNGQTTSAISNLCVGSYTATITDANGCTASSTSSVNPWNTLAVSVTSSDPTCAGACTGIASVNISAGTAPFTFNWSDPIGQVTQTASGLCTGSYSVTVADAGGCSTTASVTLAGPAPIAVNPNITQTTCGQCNGSITLNTSGGTAPYTFSWSNGSPNSTVNGLCAGVYSVDITDATGCTASFTISVSSSAGPSISASNVTDASCTGICDGAISITATGGIAPYTYLWLPGNQNTATVNNLCAGTYTVLVRDSAGCTFTQSFTVAEPAAITPNQLITNTDCGFCSGSIVLNPSGGTGPYTYSWAPGGQTTSTISSLCAGLYTVTITDATGCSNTLPVPVSNVNTGIAVSTSGTSVSCNGSCDGTAIVTASGGNSPYTYSWSNSATNDTISGLCAGNYLVQATDASGCVATTQINITEPTQLAGSFLFVQDELCTGACNGTMTAIPSGGTLPYTYSWTTVPVQTTITASNLCSGIYSVTVTDANGCSFTQSDTIVSPIVLVVGNPVVTDASCSNSPDGTITTNISGGALPYSYSWTGPNSFTATTANLNGVLPGTYTVNITDANGCTTADTIVVNAITTIVADAGNDTTFCQSGSITLDGSGSVNATTYQWIQLPGNTVVGSTVTLTLTPPVGTTSYVLIASNGVCTANDTVVITSQPPPVADAGPDQEILTGASTTIGGNPTGPSGSTYAWGPGTGIGDPTISNPVASPGSTTTYIVYVTDANGCTGSDTMELVVVPSIEFPNGFTPNGDGTNDVWVIDNIRLFPNCRVEVYNRWGEMLFASDGYNIPWDGRYDGKDLPVGTYYYIINLNDPLFPEVYTGPITIMR